jgi:hypothetical protein
VEFQLIPPKCTDRVDFDSIKGVHTLSAKRFLYIDEGKIARLFVKFNWEYVGDRNTNELVPNIYSFELVEFAVGRDMQTVIQTPTDNLVEVLKQKGKGVTIKSLNDEIMHRTKGQSFEASTHILSAFIHIFAPPPFIENYR